MFTISTTYIFLELNLILTNLEKKRIDNVSVDVKHQIPDTHIYVKENPDLVLNIKKDIKFTKNTFYILVNASKVSATLGLAPSSTTILGN